MDWNVKTFFRLSLDRSWEPNFLSSWVYLFNSFLLNTVKAILLIHSHLLHFHWLLHLSVELTTDFFRKMLSQFPFRRNKLITISYPVLPNKVYFLFLSSFTLISFSLCLHNQLWGLWRKTLLEPLIPYLGKNCTPASEWPASLY